MTERRNRLRIGDLRHRVTIQKEAETQDSAAQPIPNWADERTIAGLYRPTGGKEITVGDQSRSVVTGIVTIRQYEGDLVPNKRLKVNGWRLTNLILNIDVVLPPDPETGMQEVLVSQPQAGIVQ